MNHMIARLIAFTLCFLIAPVLSFSAYGQVETGEASYYSDKYHLNPRVKTASGELYDKFKFTAAHKSLPFGTNVKVTNLANGKEVVVRINDRGPFKQGRIIELSRAAAEAIDMIYTGLARVRVEVISGNAMTQRGANPNPTNNYSSSSIRRVEAGMIPGSVSDYRDYEYKIYPSENTSSSSVAQRRRELSDLPLVDELGRPLNTSSASSYRTSSPVSSPQAPANQRQAGESVLPTYLPENNRRLAGSGIVLDDELFVYEDHSNLRLTQAANARVASSRPAPTTSANQRVANVSPTQPASDPSIYRIMAVKEEAIGFGVQVSAFFDTQRLMEGLDEMARKGINNTLVQQGNKNGRTVYRIIVGPYTNKAEADQARQRLKAAGNEGITVNLAELR